MGELFKQMLDKVASGAYNSIERLICFKSGRQTRMEPSPDQLSLPQSEEPTGAPRIGFGRRLGTIGLLAALGIALLIAVPALRPVLREVRHMSGLSIALAMALELASCVSFVVVFRLLFDRIPAREARYLAWTEMSSGALLPGGGVGGYAVGGWLMSLTGAKAGWIVRRSSSLFFLTTAINSLAVIGSSVWLVADGGQYHDALRAWLPLALALPATVIVASLPWTITRRLQTAARWPAGIIDGIGDAWQAAAHPNWRLLGAVGYLFFDIAVLWTTFTAVGHAPTPPELILGYTIGYLANSVPVPGGIGVLDAGLAGALLLYGASPAHVVAAVLVYHAIAFWLPSLGGALAYAWLRPRLLRNATSSEQAPVPQTTTLKGSADDITRFAHQTNQQRLGRVPDQRAGTRPVSRNLRQTQGFALPRPLSRQLIQGHAAVPPAVDPGRNTTV
jgi:uncharacterized membrane protein YbhN (UPF0104 family)